MIREKAGKRHIALLILGVLAIITILFFAGEKLLSDGWYYIPDRAILIAMILCMLWQGVVIIGAYLLSKHLKAYFKGWGKNIITIFTFAITVFIILFIAWDLFLYSAKFDEKVEQYDEHIALYVNNTFVRTKYREPHYRYETNWLFMRKLSDSELNESIRKYGNPDDYYN